MDADRFESKTKSAYLAIISGDDDEKTLTLVFSLTECVGGLADALKLFKERQINLKHIESRPSKVSQNHYDFYVDIDQKTTSNEKINTVVEDLKGKATNVVIHNDKVPWFPRKISDLDKFADRILSYGAELDSNHPGFTDEVYRARRKEFADIAMKYRHGDPLPRVEYTQAEIETWNIALAELTSLYPTHACREMNYIFPLLVQNCGYRIGHIPQMEDVSKFLKECTGFTLRPVAGLLSSRDFLGGLAFRVFHSTQYVRHQDNPRFAPEPDVIHELIGHVPLFSDPSFAQFSQEIGLASLGAPDDWIEKLSALYWFTVEFGLCRQNGELRAYGAALLSSFGELQYSIGDEPEHLEFEPNKISTMTYPITTYQPCYFIAESFEDAKNKVRAWARKIPKPFSIRYNPYTQCIETLDDKNRIFKLISEMKSDMDLVGEALSKIV